MAQQQHHSKSINTQTGVLLSGHTKLPSPNTEPGSLMLASVTTTGTPQFLAPRFQAKFFAR
jgi:hypothetical protein